MSDVVPFDVISGVARTEWDTLLFFYGVVLCVGGLGFIGFLSLASELMYIQWRCMLGLSSEMHATPAQRLANTQII